MFLGKNRLLISTDIVVGVPDVFLHARRRGTTDIEFSVTSHRDDLNLDKRDFVTVTRGCVAGARGQRCVFNEIGTTLFWDRDKSLFLCLLVDIGEVGVLKLHATYSLELFLHTTAHLYSPLKVLLNILFREVTIGVH